MNRQKNANDARIMAGYINQRKFKSHGKWISFRLCNKRLGVTEFSENRTKIARAHTYTHTHSRARLSSMKNRTQGRRECPRSCRIKREVRRRCFLVTWNKKRNKIFDHVRIKLRSRSRRGRREMKTGRKRRSHDTHKFAHRLKKSCCYLFVLFLVVEPSEATRGWNTDRKEKKTTSYEREMYLYIISICHRGRKPGVRRFDLADHRSPDLLGRHMHIQTHEHE